MQEKIVQQSLDFDWDEANGEKNWSKHAVSQNEIEQVFFNEPLLFEDDIKHSSFEMRSYVLGKTDNGRKLFVVFTIRNNMIRVISARDMSRKERNYYEEIESDTKI